MKHEPSRFLRHADGPMQFHRTDTITAIGDEPNGGEPFIQSEGRILEDGACFGAELAFCVFDFAFPTALDRHPAGIFMSTRRAADAIFPAKLDHSEQAYFGVSEVLNCFS